MNILVFSLYLSIRDSYSLLLYDNQIHGYVFFIKGFVEIDNLIFGFPKIRRSFYEFLCR